MLCLQLPALNLVLSSSAASKSLLVLRVVHQPQVFLGRDSLLPSPLHSQANTERVQSSAKKWDLWDVQEWHLKRAVQYLLAVERLIPQCRKRNSPHQIKPQASNIYKTYILGIYLNKQIQTSLMNKHNRSNKNECNAVFPAAQTALWLCCCSGLYSHPLSCHS